MGSTLQIEHWSVMMPAFLLAGFSIFWVAGFDIIYALLDEDSDRQNQIHSMPADFGKANALRASLIFHAFSLLCLSALVGNYLHSLTAAFIFCAIAGLFVLSHWKVSRAQELTPDIIDFAFFKVNATIGFLVFALVLTGAFK